MFLSQILVAHDAHAQVSLRCEIGTLPEKTLRYLRLFQLVIYSDSHTRTKGVF